jgi:hypothetical protein
MGNPVPFVCLAEDDDWGGDKLIFTGSSDNPNFAGIPHTLAGWCAPKWHLDTDNWNDCVTSYWAKLGTSDSVCFYGAANYGSYWFRHATMNVPAGAVWTFSNRNITDPLWRDQLTALILQQSGTPCGSGGFA